ncbi:UDP-2,4-diacetamido-2,4,6-trideoxy-beta-L-altropyranose hydrolase [Anabaena azotica]|uniref:UDP-2,4-diacetamido-2,4, 6-trideoxy-beta-L-altropyranose hydrolase n=1 Tax=Anabaena azotica TaxID=197653 RepID=UPI0039A61EE1
MSFVFRVDSSSQIGTGHLMRCLVLAEQLHKISHDITFIVRSLPGSLENLIQQKGFDVYQLHNDISSINLDVDWKIDAEETTAFLKAKPKEISWLIVDHYGLDYQWELKIRPYIQNLMVIDDLANRHHDCDLLLDQNFYNNYEIRYDNLVKNNCKKMLGLKYVLLREEFREVKKTLRTRDGNIQQILVFFGGSDPNNQTLKALKAIQLINRPNITVNVVVGESNQHKELVRTFCNQMPNTNFYCQVNNMADLIAKADLALASGGTNTWERCFLELPTVTIEIATNQIESLQDLGKKGVIINLGWHENVNIQELSDEIIKLLNNPNLLTQMSSNCKMLNISSSSHLIFESIKNEIVNMENV